MAVVYLGPKTSAESPLTVFGNIQIHFDIECKISTKEKSLWAGGGQGRAQQSIGPSFIVPFMFYPIGERAMRLALQEALDNLIQAMLKDRDIISRG